MQSLLPCLSNPAIEQILGEWKAVRMDSTLTLPAASTPAGAAVIECIRRFFAALSDLATEYRVLYMMREGNQFDVDVDAIGEALRQAQDLCTGPCFHDALCALLVLRRRLQGNVHGEAEVIRQLDEVVGLLAPGFSLAELWKEVETEDQRERVWAVLGDLMLACAEETWVTRADVAGSAVSPAR